MRKFGGFFMRYTKPALTFEGQFDLISSRGLQIEDRIRVMRWLKRVSYYRLSAYFLPFKEPGTERFREGTTFDQVAGLYIFDRKLRLVLLDAIERVEVATRTSLTYELAHKCGPFGYTDAKNFSSEFNHAAFMTHLEEARAESRETFIDHFNYKYTSEPYLPIWMATELLSFGVISRLYKSAPLDIKKKMSLRYDVQPVVFANWLHTLSYVRNLCAHHSRVWNRQLAIRPMIPHPGKTWPHQIPTAERLYSVLTILQHLLLRMAPQCAWKSRLLAVFDAHPNVDLTAMGMPTDWRHLSPWA
jgi:abortive infection bacteriophage resistance protein